MNSLKSLITAINDDSTVQRFKQLEKIVDSDAKLKKEFNKLLDLQKLLVQAEAKKTSKMASAKVEYDTQEKIVLGHVLMSEYLDLLEIVNNDLQLIKTIITEEIDMDFE